MKIYLYLLLFFIPLSTFAQDSTLSSAFKDNLPNRKYPLIKPKYPSYPLMTGFLLTQEAKKGDPFAQHELGLRYLLGRGFAPDTILAVSWIKKAANQKLAAAQFNYAIMLINGTGTEWNPFEAFERFKFAAESKMPEGQYMYGVLMTDDLIVNKNIPEAYRWIKRASEAGFEPADEALKSMEESGLALPVVTEFSPSVNTELDSADYSNFRGALFNSPIELDFYDFGDDSTSNDEKLLDEIFKKKPADLKNILGIARALDVKENHDTTAAGIIKFASEAGSPEALILEAKRYEHGYLVRRDPILAASKYIRSLRLGSQRSAALLLKLVRDEKFFGILKKRVDSADPNAMYVWAGLIAMGFDHRLNNEQALELLESAADENHIYSIIELGLCYYSGTLVDKNKEMAMEYWQRAFELGNDEGRVRIILDKIKQDNKRSALDDDIKFLLEASESGSVLAEVALAYCYENGIGVKSNKADAVKYYRNAAQRGNEASFNSLRSMYDALRPNDDKFIIVE